MSATETSERSGGQPASVFNTSRVTAVRAEVADILAGALWSLICAGQVPRARHAPVRQGTRPKHVETTGD